MFRSYSTSIRWFVLPLLAAIGLVLAITADSVQAQGFRRPTVFHSPVAGFNGNRTFAPTPIGINLQNRGLTPAAAQYIQANRNTTLVANSAARLQFHAQNGFGPYGLAANYAYLNSIYGYNPSWYGNPYGYGAYNPYYAQSSYGSPYAYGTGYGYGNSGYGSPYGYGAGYGYGNSGYGSPYSSGAGYGSGLGYADSGYATPASTAPPAPAPRVVAAVSAFGVPTNDDGTLAWPFAFRLMSPDAKRELLDPLAAQMEAAANQASKGKANPNVIRESQQGVDRLYQWLRTHRLDLAEGSVRDANAFLGQIDVALRAMRPEA